MERGREVVKQFGGDPDAVRRHATASAAVWVEVPDDRADELSTALDSGQIVGLACFQRMGAMPRVEFRAPRHVREWLGGQPVARIEWAMGELARLEARVAALEQDMDRCGLHGSY